MKSRTNLKTVAQEAGVSTTTVSRYLNGTLELPKATRDRIDAAVIKLNYHPNPHARRLSLGRSDTIAVILPDIANPFFAKLAAAIELAATSHNSMVLLHATFNKRDRELEALKRASQNRVDGVVFVTNRTPEPEVARQLNEFSRAVILDEDVPAALRRVFCVTMNWVECWPVATYVLPAIVTLHILGAASICTAPKSV